jgi:hypothetical protein
MEQRRCYGFGSHAPHVFAERALFFGAAVFPKESEVEQQVRGQRAESLAGGEPQCASAMKTWPWCPGARLL